MHNRKIKIIALSGLAALSGLLAIAWMASASGRIAIIGQAEADVDLAITAQDHYLGLSGRTSLPADSGMLFVFNPKEKPVFVMRLMNFPLDIIWISDGKIVKIDKDLEPEGSAPKKSYQAPVPVDYVLEVNAGFSERHHLSAGDNFSIKRKNIF